MLACARATVPFMNPETVDNPFGGKVIYLPQTESTMLDARELGRSGPNAHGSVVVAGFQSAGRGRGGGRSWICPSGEGLLFTLVLADPSAPRPYGLSTLPLRAGLALARALEEDYHLTARVKWPNDVLVSGRKIAGILCEAYPGFQLLAMGINVGLRSVPPGPAGNDAAALRWPATSLAEQAGSPPEHGELLTRVLYRVQAALKDDRWLTELNERLFGLDRRVRFLTGRPGDQIAAVGRVMGIAESGSIRIRRESDGRELSFPGGELEFFEDSQEG